MAFRALHCSSSSSSCSGCVRCFDPSSHHFVDQRCLLRSPSSLSTFRNSSLGRSRSGDGGFSDVAMQSLVLAPNGHLLDRKSVPEHLVIMVSGIVGSASNWKFAADQFKLKLGDKVAVHCSDRNVSTSTFDGVDVMGHRLAEEVRTVIDQLPGVKKISFIAHSLGGLVARYAIGQLYTPAKGVSASHQLCRNEPGRCRNLTDEEIANAVQRQGTIAGLQAINFITVATPHLGSRGSSQLPFLCGVPVFEKVASLCAHWFVGRTGNHLFLTDNDKSQFPLLLRMVSDCDEGQFISSLHAFKRCVAYANVSFDHMVGWRTASIRRECELPEASNVPIDERYPHIVLVEDVPSNTHDPDINYEPASDLVEEEMIVGLRQVSWQRVDVNFFGSRQRLSAHNTIQVKYYWMHSEGADVIAHIIDNFVT